MKDLYEKYCGCDYRVTTDSRAVKGGEMFFALRGENFDGNNFAMGALGDGAAWAVVNADAQLPDDGRLIRVQDPLATLRELAIWHRTHVCEGKLPVIGLTGTNGKTTTKELIAAVLSRKFAVTATRGNLNNDIGVPLSLLSITPQTQIAVIEMGANHPDDIEKLVQVSRPDYGSQTFSSEVGGRNRDDVRGSWEGYNDKIPASGAISQSSKDKAFVKRVKPIVDQLGPRSAGAEFDENGHTFGFDTQILDVRVRGGKYVYISEPPYASYIFFNMGADGEYDHGAPSDRSKPKNRDNIYATLEDD